MPAHAKRAIWYLSGATFIGGACGPRLPSGWALVTVSDFNADNKPDYLLYNAGTRQTAIWALNNNMFMGGALLQRFQLIESSWCCGLQPRQGKADYLL